MPRKVSIELQRMAQTLQWDRGRWFWLLLILLTLDVVLALGDTFTAILRYERGAIASGGWWRLLTAHLVHLDLHHLVLNELGLVLMWSLFAEDFDALGWLFIVFAGALAISSGLWWLSPRIAWYVGASGVLHAVLGAGTAQHLLARVWDRWLLLAVLVGKLLFEQFAGHDQPNVVVDAHLYGAVAGFLAGAALSARIAIIRPRSR